MVLTVAEPVCFWEDPLTKSDIGFKLSQATYGFLTVFSLHIIVTYLTEIKKRTVYQIEKLREETVARIFSIVLLCQLRSEISLHFCQNAFSPTPIVQMGYFFRVMQQPQERDELNRILDPCCTGTLVPGVTNKILWAFCHLVWVGYAIKSRS